MNAAIFSYVTNIKAAVDTVCSSLASRPLYNPLTPCSLRDKHRFTISTKHKANEHKINRKTFYLMNFLPSFRDKNGNAGPQKVKENLLHDSFMLKFRIGAVKMHQHCKHPVDVLVANIKREREGLKWRIKKR